MGASTAAAGGRHEKPETSAAPGPAPEPAPAHHPRTWHARARRACWAGFFAAGLLAGTVWGLSPRAGLFAGGAGGVLTVALIALRRAERHQRLPSAWHRSQVHALTGDLAVLAAAGRIGACEERLAVCEDRIAGVDRRETMIEAGLEAAFDAAGISQPRPVLRLVQREYGSMG